MWKEVKRGFRKLIQGFWQIHLGSLHLGIVYFSFKMFPLLNSLQLLYWSRLMKRAGWQSSGLQLPISKTGIRPTQKGPREVALTVFCLKECLTSQKIFLTALMSFQWWRWSLPVKQITASIFLVLDIPGDEQRLFAVIVSVITLSAYIISPSVLRRQEMTHLGTRPVVYMQWLLWITLIRFSEDSSSLNLQDY